MRSIRYSIKNISLISEEVLYDLFRVEFRRDELLRLLDALELFPLASIPLLATLAAKNGTIALSYS